MTSMQDPKDKPPSDDDRIFEDSHAIIKLAQRAFARAVEKALDENDRLGIPSPGGRDGKIVWRMPPKTREPG